MTDFARLLLHVLALATGLAIGWHGRGWHDGSTVTAASADVQAQSAVDAGTQAAVTIDRAKAATDRAVERVREVRVPVAAECPPGAGAMSQDMEIEVRQELRR